MSRVDRDRPRSTHKKQDRAREAVFFPNALEGPKSPSVRLMSDRPQSTIALTPAWSQLIGLGPLHAQQNHWLWLARQSSEQWVRALGHGQPPCQLRLAARASHRSTRAKSRGLEKSPVDRAHTALRHTRHSSRRDRKRTEVLLMMTYLRFTFQGVSPMFRCRKTFRDTASPISG